MTAAAPTDHAPRSPIHLWIVRHGESAGNLAYARAQAAGADLIDIAERDVDVPLSPLGQQQAAALGRWFAALPDPPNVVVASPYVRAHQTALAILPHTRAPRVRLDERLREREFGVLDRLTAAGVATRHPDQAEFRRRLGKFYHRPPGGESWVDVIARLRAFLDTVALQHAGCRVLLVAHQVVVLCLRYVLEDLDEARLLAIDSAADVANCSVTEYAFEAGEPRLLRYNFTTPLEAEGAPVTAAPDKPVGPK